MNRVLLIYEDDSFEVLSEDEYIRRPAEANRFREPVRQAIYRDSVPGISEERCYICRAQSANSRWMNLSQFPDEIKALLVLYEI